MSATIFLVVCAACLLLAVVAVAQSVRLMHSGSPPAQVRNPPGTPSEQEKAEFDWLRDRTDNTQKLITTLIALASLYAIVLTVTGYLNVNKVVQDAKASLADAISIKEKLGQEYGSLGYVSHNLQQVTRELKARLPDVQELSLLIKRLSPEDRERIYFQEKAVAFAQLVFSDQDARSSRRLSESLVGVARFYRGLYLLEKRKLKAERAARAADGTAGEAWWKRVDREWEERRDALRERALFYAQQGVSRSPRNYIALNELGNCLLEFDKARDDEAHAYFGQSLECHNRQQKARYHRSVYQHKRGDYIGAELLLTEALALDRWENTEIRARRNDLHYNRACALCKQAEACAAGSAAQASLLQRSLEDLIKAEVTRARLNISDFRSDLEAGGDLEALARDATYTAQLKQLRDRAAAAWTQLSE